MAGFDDYIDATDYSSSDSYVTGLGYAMQHNLQTSDILRAGNEIGYTQKLNNTILSAQQKMDLIKDNLLQKNLHVSDFQIADSLDADDGDTITIQGLNGDPLKLRLQSLNFHDSADLEEDVLNSAYKRATQPLAVANMYGIRPDQLTPDHYANVEMYAQNELARSIMEPDFKPQKFDPNKLYTHMNIENAKIGYKITGIDKYGRPLAEVINLNTGRDITFDMSQNPEANMSFDLYNTIDNGRNRRRLRQYEQKSLLAASKFDPDIRFRRLQAEQAEFDKDSRWGEDIDLIQSTALQSVARFMQHVSDDPDWKRLANSETGQRWADLAVGVRADTRESFVNAGQSIQEHVKNGEYKEAVRETISNLDRFLAESAPQMGMLAVGMWATGGLAALGAGGRLAALGLGAVPVALDKTLQDAEDFKVNNGREMTSAEYARTFAGALLTTVPEELVFGMFGNTAKGLVSKLLKRGLGTSITKSTKQLAFDAGKRFLGSVAGEGGQEWMETTWDNASSARQNRPFMDILKDTATSDETLTAGLIGATMGGALGGFGSLAGFNADLSLNNYNKAKQAEYEQKRVEETPAGTKANSKISEEALGRMSKITVEPGQSAKDSKAALDALSKEDNYLLNGKASEEKYKKVSQANLNIATEMVKNGSSDEEIEKATGKSKKDIFADYAYTYGSGYNSEYARRHNIKYSKADNDAMEKELMAIAKSLGLTKEEARKTLDEVKIDIRRGPNGYENFGAQIKKGHEILENNPNLSDEEKLDITNTIKGYAARLFHLYGYQTAKLEAFADKYDLIDEGKASRTYVPYPNQKKGFDLNGNKLASYSFDTKFNAHGVVQDIYDSLKEMQAIMDDPSVMAKTTRDAYIQGYNANFGLKVDTTAPDTLYKRIRSAADRIFVRGIQETKPVAQITDKDRVNVVGKLEKMLQLEEEKKQGSESWSEKRRYFFKALRDQPDAYDKITGFIDNNDKISPERKEQLKKRLTELKDSLATTDARMQQNAADRDTAQAKAKNILKTVTADFLKQHSYVSGKDTPEKWEAKKKRLELLHDDLVKTYTDVDGNKHLSLIKQLEETSNNSVEDKKLIQDLKKLANDINNTKRNSDTLYRREHKPVNKPSKLITGTTISKNKIELSEAKIKNIKNSDVEPLNNHLNNLLRDMDKNRQDQQTLIANNQSTTHKKEEMSKLYAEAELVIETLMEKAPDRSYKKETLTPYNNYKLSDEELTSQPEQATSQSKTSTTTSSKLASRKAVQGQMSESAKKAFDALAKAKKIDTLKGWEAYYDKEKNKYKLGTQEYADVMQTKAYVTKLINELTKPQKFTTNFKEKVANLVKNEWDNIYNTQKYENTEVIDLHNDKTHGKQNKWLDEAKTTYYVYGGRNGTNSKDTYIGNEFPLGSNPTENDRKKSIQDCWNNTEWVNNVEKLISELKQRKKENPSLKKIELGCWCAPKPCHLNLVARLVQDEVFGQSQTSAQPSATDTVSEPVKAPQSEAKGQDDKSQGQTSETSPTASQGASEGSQEVDSRLSETLALGEAIPANSKEFKQYAIPFLNSVKALIKDKVLDTTNASKTLREIYGKLHEFEPDIHGKDYAVTTYDEYLGFRKQFEKALARLNTFVIDNEEFDPTDSKKEDINTVKHMLSYVNDIFKQTIPTLDEFFTTVFSDNPKDSDNIFKKAKFIRSLSYADGLHNLLGRYQQVLKEIKATEYYKLFPKDLRAQWDSLINLEEQFYTRAKSLLEMPIPGLEFSFARGVKSKADFKQVVDYFKKMLEFNNVSLISNFNIIARNILNYIKGQGLAKDIPNGLKVFEELVNRMDKIANNQNRNNSKEPINVWYKSNENAQFSNLASRPFKYEGRDYKSVEHAYQSLKSGKFDEETYKKNWDKYPKIAGNKGTDFKTNLQLMKNLILASFQQNEQAKNELLATGNRSFTHNQAKDSDIWKKEFPRLLTEVREELRNRQNQPSQSNASNTPENAPRIDQNAQDGKTSTETQQVPQNGSQSEIQAPQKKKAYEPDNDQKAIMDAFGLTDEVFTKKPKRSDFEEGALGNQKFLMATGLYAAAQSASLDSEVAPLGATDVDEEAEMPPVTDFENTPMEPIGAPTEPNIPQEAIASTSTKVTVSSTNTNTVSSTPIKASDIVTREQLEQTAKDRSTVELVTNRLILNAKNDTSRVASESLQSKSKGLKEGEARPEYHLANQFEIIAPKSFVAYDQDAYEPHFKKREAVYNKIKLQITGAKTSTGTVVERSLDFFVTEHPSKLYEMEEITNEDGTTVQILKESDTAVSRSMLDNMPHARIIYDMLVKGDDIEFELNDYTAKMVDFTLVQAAGSGQLESLMVKHSATPDEALRMFGLDEDTASAAQKAALVKLINNSGSSAQRVASYLGRQLLLNMGLIKSSKGFEQEYERIAVGLGLHMITYGEKLGLLKINKVQLRDNNNKLLEGVDTALGSVFGAKNLTLLSPLDPKNEVLLDLKDQWEGHVDKDGTPLGDGIKRFERERPETSKQIYGKPSQHNASETLYVRNTKKSNTVGQTQKDFVFGTLNGIEYKLDMGAAKTILNSANAFRSYMGYKFDSEGKNIANNPEELGKLSLNAQLRVCGVNKDIDSQLEALANCIKDIEEIRANGGTEKDTSIYFEHFVSRNLRFFIDSTEINPQVKKIQRFCITPRKAWYEYDLSEVDENNEEAKKARTARDMLENFALAQAFDNIKNTDNAINTFAETIKGWDLKTIKKLKTIFDTCKSKEEFEARTEKELKLKLGMENAPQALGAIIHLGRRAKAREKGLSSFYTNFMVENDATTSGYAVKFANMPLQSILEATFKDEKGNIIRDKDGKPLKVNLMEKVGIFKFNNREEFEEWKKGFEVKDKDGNIIQAIGDNDVTMHLIKAQKGFQDIYRTTGLGVHQQLVTLNTVEAFKKRIEGPQKRKNEKISDDELTKLAETVDDIYQTLRPALPKADVNEDTKEVTIGGKLRELMKYPTMFFGYSAGMKTISRNVANILLDEYSDVYMMICNMGIDYYKENYKNDKDYAKNIAIYNTFEKLDKMRSKPHGTLADNMREKLFSEIWLEQGERRLTLDRYFEDLIGATYGDAIGKVLENQFGDYVHINNMIIWATTTMYQMYAKRREEGIKKLLETYTNGKILISAIEELTESLYEQYPFIRTASSQMGLGNKPDSRIDLMKDRKQIDSTTQVQNYIYNDKGQLENNVTGYGESIIPATPGRSGAVLPIHGLDSHEIMYTGKIVPLIPINTVHDALVMSAFDQILPTRGYNAATLVLGDSYNILQEIYDNFKRCCDAEIESKYQEKLEKAKHNEYVDRNLIEEEFYKNVIVDDRGNTVDILEYAKGANEKENNEIVYEGEFTRRYLKERMERWVKFINDAREAFYGNGAIIYCCNSDGAMGSGYVYQRQPGAPMNADERLKQLINKDQQLRYGSTYAGYKTDSELKILHQRALNDPKARNEILHDLNGMAKDTNDLVVSDEFMKELEDLVLNANPEALKDSIYELIENGQFTAGDTLISKTGEARVRVFMDDKQHIDTVTQRAVESQMAPAEIFAHEIEHAVLHPAFTMTEALGFSDKIQELNRYYEIARGLIKAEDFMIEGDYDPNLRDLYKRHAQRSYEYFFNNPDIANNRGLHEWAALIRTSEKFRNILKQRYTEKYGEKPATKFIDKLINLIKSITDVLFRRKSLVQAFPNIFGSASTKAKTQGLQLLDEIDNIIDTIARANNRAVKKLEQHPAKAKEAFFKFLGTWVQNHNRPLGQWMKKHTIELAKTMGWDKLGIDKKIPVRGSFFDTAKLYASTVLMYPISPRHRKMWRELLTRVFKVSQQGLLFSICRDFVKPDYNSSMLEFQALQSKTADTDSKAIEGLVRTDLEKGFDRKLNLEERVSLTHSLLYTDAQCLLYRGFNYIRQALTSDLFREHEIQKHLDYLKKKFRSDDDYYWMCSQCMGTARFMVTGQGNEQLNTNAYGIAIGNFYDKPIEFDEETYHHLDELITLYAIQNTADDYKTLAMSLDQKGLENFLNTHRDFVDESTNGVKVDDMDMSKTKQILEPIHVVKGYTKALIDTTYETQLAPIDDQSQRLMRAQGFKLVHKIYPNDVTKKDYVVGLYKRYGIPKRRDGAAFNLIGYHAMGTTLESMSYQDVLSMPSNKDDDPVVLAEKRIRLAELYKKNAEAKSAQLRKRMTNGPMTFADFDKLSYGFSPIASPIGSGQAIADYRITMSLENKRKIFGLDEDGITELSKMFASMNKKAKASAANKELIKFLIDDMKKNMDPDTHLGKHGKAYNYIKLSEFTDNKYLKEAWRVLPKELKEAMKEQEIWVREDWLQQLFGVSNMSLNDTWLVKKIPSYYLKRLIGIAEMIMKTIAYYRKQSIVLKIPGVLIGNIVSNFMFSVANHANPLKVLKLTILNAKAIREYLNTKKQLNTIILKQRLGTATNDEIASKNLLRTRLQNNMVHPLMEMGMYQSIVEDLNPEELESTGKLTKLLKYNKYSDKIPTGIKNVARHIFLAEGTPIHDFMFTATQYSDFIARATEYQLTMEKQDKVYKNLMESKPTPENKRYFDKKEGYERFKKDYKQIALIRVLNAFINYDKPQSKFEQYMNDIGALIFSKFAKRIQHVIAEQLWENPLGALAFLLSQHFLVDTEDIFEQNVFNKNWSALFNTPWDNFQGAVVPMPLQILFGNQKFMG